MPEGTYTVTFDLADVGIGYAHGAFTVATGFTVPSEATLPIDIAMVDVAVAVTVDGARPPHGKVYLASEVEYVGWLDEDGTMTARVPPGTYGVVYVPAEDELAASWWLTVHPCVQVR